MRATDCEPAVAISRRLCRGCLAPPCEYAHLIQGTFVPSILDLQPCDPSRRIIRARQGESPRDGIIRDDPSRRIIRARQGESPRDGTAVEWDERNVYSFRVSAAWRYDCRHAGTNHRQTAALVLRSTQPGHMAHPMLMQTARVRARAA